MKDAQDAVKEIREWPMQKYLIENEDGSIEFSDNKPGRVVCTRDEFVNALKETDMKTPAEAGKACGGVWPVDGPMPGMGILRGRRDTLERRPVPAPGYNPDDVAFNSYDWDGEGFPDTEDSCEAFVYADTVSGGKWVQGEVDGHARSANAGTGCLFRDTDGLLHFIGTTAHFRPLKSDRERWKEAAETIWNDEAQKAGDPFGAIYDTIISGELPTPEGK